MERDALEAARDDVITPFLNLMVNSLQAMAHLPPERRVLSVRAYERDGFVCVDVMDRGTGIEPAVAERIFDAFFTTKDTVGTEARWRDRLP